MSSITNVYYIPSLLGAFTVEDPATAYPVGSFVHTFGFSAAGDGGAAMYKVISGAPSGAKSYTVAGVSFNYADGKFYVSSSSVFQLIPQHGKVYAEQFGVFSGDVAYASNNVLLFKKAIVFATQNSCTLTFASAGMYYLNPVVLVDSYAFKVQSGMHIDGNGATLSIINTPDHISKIDLFNSYAVVDNVTIKNITLIGRKIAAKSGYADQAIHIKCSNFTVQNVRFKYFEYAFHTYGGSTVGEYKVVSDGETKSYAIADSPNKNWLIDSCKTESCVFGINTSEIDGLVIKDSDISCYTTSDDTAHCVYLSSNCSNVRVTGCSLHNVSGDAIHKAYAYTTKLDSSKNHFYTDLSIHNADSALDIGRISRNVMCDNVFATEVDVVLQLSGADNCIVSNSYFGQAEDSSKTTTFVYTEGACNCWIQNSYIYYVGKHRVASSDPPSAYVRDMYADKKHRRMFIGAEFKINSYAIKFTGCKIVSAYTLYNYYFDTHMSGTEEKPVRTAVTEYWDNCTINLNTEDNLFRLKCTSDIPTGLTIRNCYFRNDYNYDNSKALFKLQCDNISCNCCTNDDCSWKSKNKRFPWVRMENVILDNAGYWLSSSWAHIIAVHKPSKTFVFALADAVKISNSYATNCYKITNGKKTEISNLMAR